MRPLEHQLPPVPTDSIPVTPMQHRTHAPTSQSSTQVCRAAFSGLPVPCDYLHKVTGGVTSRAGSFDAVNRRRLVVARRCAAPPCHPRQGPYSVWPSYHGTMAFMQNGHHTTGVGVVCLLRGSMVWFRWGCTASCGRNVRCVGVRGDAWSVLLSPCNTTQ